MAYRLKAIAIGRLALLHHMSWNEVPDMEVFFNGVQVIDGKATGFTNAAIDAAIIHCRSILEFLGLQSTKSSATGIVDRPVRTNADDIGVEHFAGLAKLTRAKALDAYPGGREEAEAALALIFHSANKGLAHTTGSFKLHSGDAQLLEIAFRGVPRLLVNGFYDPMGITPPSYELTSRPRVA